MTDTPDPIAQAAAAIQRLNESILSDLPDDIANTLDSLADSDGPLSPLRDFLDSTAAWISTLSGDKTEDARHDIDNAVSSLDKATEAIQNAATSLRTTTD